MINNVISDLLKNNSFNIFNNVECIPSSDVYLYAKQLEFFQPSLMKDDFEKTIFSPHIEEIIVNIPIPTHENIFIENVVKYITALSDIYKIDLEDFEYKTEDWMKEVFETLYNYYIKNLSSDIYTIMNIELFINYFSATNNDVNNSATKYTPFIDKRHILIFHKESFNLYCNQTHYKIILNNNFIKPLLIKLNPKYRKEKMARVMSVKL